MTLILNVQAGTLVFLDCGCQGRRMPSRPDAPVLVIVEGPCEAHLKDGRPQLRYLDPFESVSPFTRDRPDGKLGESEPS